MNGVPAKLALTIFIAVATAMTAWGQLPIPVPGQPQAQGGAQAGPPGGGRGGGEDFRGRGRGRGAEPVKQVVTPIPTAEEVTGPGEFYETFMDDHDDVKNINIPAKDTYAKYNYEAKEYFISGETAGGTPYKTRIVIRKPKDNSKFNGLILAESMHPSGNPWVFHFTQVYCMTNGVVGLEILTSTPAGFIAANEARYNSLVVIEAQTREEISGPRTKQQLVSVNHTLRIEYRLSRNEFFHDPFPA